MMAKDRKAGYAALGAAGGAVAAPALVGAAYGHEFARAFEDKKSTLKNRAIGRGAVTGIGAVAGPPTVANMTRSRSTRGAALKILGAGAVAGGAAGAAYGHNRGANGKKKIKKNAPSAFGIEH